MCDFRLWISFISGEDYLCSLVEQRHIEVFGCQSLPCHSKQRRSIEKDFEYFTLRHGRQTKVSLRDLTFDEVGDQDKSGVVRAPMHGKVLEILVEQGAQVTRGQRVAIIEAMKMEHTLVAPTKGVVADIAAGRGAQVAEGAKIMRIAPAAESKE